MSTTTPNPGQTAASGDAAPAAPKMVVETYFPTLLGFQDWTDAEQLNAEVRERIYGWMDGDPEGLERSNARSMGAWHSATDMHERPEFAAFAQRIHGAVREYFDTLGCDPECPPVCDGMWANVSPRHAYNRSHTHGNTVVSGVYYVYAESVVNGHVNFYDPRVQAIAAPTYASAAKSRPHTWPKVFFEPKPGRVILFPGWLRHDVDPNLSTTEGRDGDRVSVSFNYYQRRRPS